MLDCNSHIKEEYPKEACGLICDSTYYACKNISTSPLDSFVICPKDMSRIMDIGDIEYIVHSHCNSDAKPSASDLKAMQYFSYDWIIYSCNDKGIVDKRIYDNTGKEIQNR